ncbi:MAG: OmpH family outer membrane protein [Hyphomonadaceae bacterium]|nr:OmpH family outer membrane protein [Hyphomonadaceae bacterium]
MRVISSICAAAVIAAAVVASPDALAQRNRGNDNATTVVVIDYQRVVSESAIGRDMQARLTQIRTDIQTEAQTLAPEGQAIEAERQRLAAATRTLTPEQIRDHATYGPQYRALAERFQALQLRTQTLEGDMQCSQLIALRDFDTAISPIVRSVMEGRGAGVVLDSRNVQMTLPAFDITTIVIQQLDQGAATRTLTVTRRPVTECQAPVQPPAQ